MRFHPNASKICFGAETAQKTSGKPRKRRFVTNLPHKTHLHDWFRNIIRFFGTYYEIVIVIVIPLYREKSILLFSIYSNYDYDYDFKFLKEMLRNLGNSYPQKSVITISITILFWILFFVFYDSFASPCALEVQKTTRNNMNGPLLHSACGKH